MNKEIIDTCFEATYTAKLTLVNWLLTRTERRQLKWVIEPDVASTMIPGPVSFQFIICPPSVNISGWCLFSARNDYGELFRALPDSSPNSPLIGAVNALFRAITKPKTDQIH